jgi:RNA polymerase sigma-70 factor (ECF subfamily)
MSSIIVRTPKTYPMLGPKRTDAATAPAPAGLERATTREQDGALVGRVANGDMIAFEALYRGFYPRLRRFLERMTRRPHLVDEIVNDTMLVVWRKAATYDFTSTVSTWIFAIAFRKALKALKATDDPIDADVDLCPQPDGDGPDAILLSRETRAVLLAALGSLSAEQRAVVELTYFHGCGYREIATIMECPVDTVKTRMFHARRKLRGILAADRAAL